MKKYAKKIVALVLAVILVASCFAGCAKINYVTNGTIGAIKEVQNGTWNQKPEDGKGGSSDGAATSIEEFKAGTYGGVEFKTVEDVANYYVKCFDYTKTLTAPYTVDGQATERYKLVGEEKLELKSLLVEGNENKLLNNTAGGIVKTILQTGVKGLPPNWGSDPAGDQVDGVVFTKSLFTADDIQACNVKDNGDGTITMQIQPKPGEMSMHNGDSQGKFFNVLGDIAGAVAAIDILSFSQGDAKDNIIVKYQGGTGTVIIDTATNEIVGGDYVMKVHVDATHVNAAGIIKDKNASIDLDYTNHFPASDEYLKERGYVKG